MNLNENPWNDPDDGGILDGPRFRGDHDGPEAELVPKGQSVNGYFKLVPMLYVWDGNHRCEFELTAAELARLALPRFVPGRRFELPRHMKWRKSDDADMDPALARSLLSRLVRSRVAPIGLDDLVDGALEGALRAWRAAERIYEQAARERRTRAGNPYRTALRPEEREELFKSIGELLDAYEQGALTAESLEELDPKEIPDDVLSILAFMNVEGMAGWVRELRPDADDDAVAALCAVFESLRQKAASRAR